MNQKRNLSGCAVDTGCKWADYAAACMGGSFFLRMVYYFGLMNLRDIGGVEIFFGLILPSLLAVMFVLALKVPLLNQTPVHLALSAMLCVSYFVTSELSVGCVLSGVLQLFAAAVFGAACLGRLPKGSYLPLASLAALGFRVVFVDIFGFLLPLTEFAAVSYVAQCANLFSLAALSLVYLCVQITPVPAPAEAAAE